MKLLQEILIWALSFVSMNDSARFTVILSKLKRKILTSTEDLSKRNDIIGQRIYSGEKPFL